MHPIRAIPSIGLALVPLVISCADGGDSPPAQTSVESDARESSSTETNEIGTIRATLGDEELTWTALAAAEGGDGSSSATYRIQPAFGDSLLIVSVSGYPGTRPAIPGMLSLMATFSGVPEDCPCDADTPAVEYWTGSSEMYRTSGATLRLETLERGADGALRIVGSFAGTLTAEGDFEGAAGPRPIEGTFSIERVVPSPGRR